MNSPNQPSLLNILEVAAPCTVSWNSMEGGDIVRFCSQCQLNVYNLSEMPQAAAEKFLRDHAGSQRTCVRFYRRHDGTVITRDCPVGVAALQAKMKRAIVGSMTVAASLVVALFTGCGKMADANGNGPVASLMRWLSPPQPTVMQGDVCPPPTATGTAVMGQMCPPNVPDGENAPPAVGTQLPEEAAR